MGEQGSPHINTNVCKRGRHGSPRAHTFPARSHGLYGAFGRLFRPISVYVQPFFDWKSYPGHRLRKYQPRIFKCFTDYTKRHDAVVSFVWGYIAGMANTRRARYFDRWVLMCILFQLCLNEDLWTREPTKHIKEIYIKEFLKNKIQNFEFSKFLYVYSFSQWKHA